MAGRGSGDSRPAALVLRRAVVLGTPLALALVELAHPVDFDPSGPQLFDSLSPQVDRWLLVHVIQLPLFALMGLAVYLLLDGADDTVARLSRLAMGIFVVFYGAVDAIAGIAVAW